MLIETDTEIPIVIRGQVRRSHGKRKGVDQDVDRGIWIGCERRLGFRVGSVICEGARMGIGYGGTLCIKVRYRMGYGLR